MDCNYSPTNNQINKRYEIFTIFIVDKTVVIVAKMTLQEIVRILGAEVIYENQHLDKNIKHAFAADLMSDVLRLDTSEMILITGLANTQVIRTAEMSDISFILFVRNKPISAEMIKLAKENYIALLRCKQSMFKACGDLYVAGLKPVY